jgi:membrane-bound lytic murein transglycosylase MltF
VNAGAIGMVVIDDHIAKVWAEAFPDITPHPELAIATGGEIAWAVRKDCPKLTEVLNGFIATHGIGTAFGNMVYAKYFKNTKWVKNAVSADEIGKLKAAAELFKKYGAEYGFDWLMVAAQAYQESGIDQSVRSPVGAVGVMQVLPSTAAGKPIGITGIDTDMDKNIHAGVKYMNFMMNDYFKDVGLDETNKCLFAFASYNAGPAKVARLRKEAEECGLDPNKWLQNVELIAAKRIGRETVTYVRNIYKYYVAYKLALAQRASKSEAKKSL